MILPLGLEGKSYRHKQKLVPTKTPEKLRVDGESIAFVRRQAKQL
jgi:hypothetical protein